MSGFFNSTNLQEAKADYSRKVDWRYLYLLISWICLESFFSSSTICVMTAYYCLTKIVLKGTSASFFEL